MAFAPYVVVEWTSQAGGSAVTINNVQNSSLTKGVQKISDNIRSGSGSISGRRPDLLPNIKVGDKISVFFGAGLAARSVNMLVADFQINFGTIAAMDEWTITLEDAFAVLGRANIDVSWAAGTASYDAFDAVCTAAGINSFVSGTSTGLSKLSAQTLTNVNALEVAQTIVNTEQAWVSADNVALINYYVRGWQTNLATMNFTDTGTGVNPCFYNSVVFEGLADNYANQVIVKAAGFADQVTGTGDKSYSLNSYSQTAGDALNLAQYVKGVFDLQENKPSVLSWNISQQTNSLPPFDGMTFGPYGLTLTLRGVVYNCVVLGWQMSADPENMRVTYYVASSEFFAYLILDDAIYGKLDSNKLGF